jgi:low affinity Fe/Cu permease
MLEAIRKSLTRLGELTATPTAFVVFIGYVALWAVFDRASLDWHAIATLATWAMTLFIQRAEHRDTQAIHAKLDELLRVHGDAKSELTNLDKREPEEIKRHRERGRR